MSSIVCASCNRKFTHAGYSRHLSMTERPLCRALYHDHLDRSMADPQGISGSEDHNPSGDPGSGIGDPSEH